MEKLDLLIVSDEIASGIYEIRRIFDHIRTLKPGFTYDDVIDKNVTKDVLNNSKCIMFFRSRSVLDYQLAKLAKKLKKTIILFIDDDFLGLKDDYGINGAGIWNGRKKALKKMLPLMDAIMSSNDLLCDKYAVLGNIERKVRYDTPVDGSTLVRNRTKDLSRIALYINDGSIDMFDKYLRPALKKLGELKPNYFTVDLLSLHPNCNDLVGISVNYVPHMTYPEFRDYMNNSQIYIGLAPLDDEGFNKYKYFNKYIEYTRAGILGIYSDCPLYRQVIRNKENGILVSNTANDWADAVIYCVDNYEEYKRMIDSAQDMIVGQLNIDRICNKLIESIPELFDLEEECNEAKYVDLFLIKIINYESRLRERIYLFCRYFKIGGLKCVLDALVHRHERNKEMRR